jgi:hypothetical protein
MVKLSVFDADGKWTGGLFDDVCGDNGRWVGAPKPGLQEVMIRLDFEGYSAWFLLEYALPREITGEEANDSLFDQKSKCCRRTPPQALHWFAQQAFGPPPALVERVRRLVADWQVFRSSRSARSLLHDLIGRCVRDGDPLVDGPARQDLDLIERLDLLTVATSPEKSYTAKSLVEDMGVDGYILWMDGHVDRISHLFGSPDVQSTSSATALSGGQGDKTRETRVLLHQVVKLLAARLRNLTSLIHDCSDAGVGLVRLDLHLQLPEGEDPEPDMPERDALWQSAIQELTTVLSEASGLWREELGSPDQDLPRVFTAAGKGATCGPVRRPSCHELLIALSGIALSEECLTAADLKPRGISKSVARKRAVAALARNEFWLELADGLDREFEKALGLLPDAPPTKDSGQRVNYHDALAGRPDLGLPPTAKTTLRTWCRDPQAASDLGVNPQGKVAAQQPLVAGLRRLHAQKSTRRRPPQTRHK